MVYGAGMVSDTVKPKRRRWWLALPILLVLLGAAALTVYLGAPGWVRKYIEDKYPGVQVGRVEIHWTEQRLTLFDVKVDRGPIQATFPRVEVDRDKNVDVPGGSVEVTINDEAKTAIGGGPGVKVVASHLTLKVHYHDTEAELEDASVTADEVCFVSGTVTHPKVKATVHDGCVKRDKSLVKARLVQVPVHIPFAIPGTNADQEAIVTDLEVEPATKSARFKELSLAWATVVGPAKIEATDEQVHLSAPAIELTHSWIATTSVRFEHVDAVVPMSVLKGSSGAVDATVGRAKLHYDATEKALSGSQSCSEWFDAFPKPLPDVLDGMAEHFKGNLSFEVRLKPAKVVLKQDCRFECKASPISTILRQPKFTYSVYAADGSIVDREAGPGVLGWMPLRYLSHDTTQAFVLLEDPGFPTHRGIIPQALENSLKINLEKGEFAKGGSTITMQLAKNLWLRRHKSIGRKAEEAMLTFALESCFTKEQILELYLNVIEFGPNLYGIGAAAKHYFKKNASELSPEEAFFLASILPAPRKALPPKSGGLEKARHIMKGLAKAGFISSTLVDDGKPLDTSDWDLAQ